MLSEILKLQIRLIKNEEEIQSAERIHYKKNGIEQCAQQDVIGWLARWNLRQDYIKAGISNDNVIAIEGLSIINGNTIQIRVSDFALFVKNFFSETLGKENVLSCIGWEASGKKYCHFLLFPLNSRQLTPEPWIDTRSGNKLKSNIEEDFFRNFSNIFRINLGEKNTEIRNGHTPYLDNFPQVATSKEDIQEVFYTTITEESQIQTDYPKDRIHSISNAAIKYFTTGVEKGAFLKLASHDITVEQYLEEVRRYLNRIYPDISERDRELIVKKVESAATGFYFLDELINDPHISDIKVMSPWKIRVKVEGSRRTSNLKFIDAEDYYRFLDGLVTRYNLNDKKSIHVFTDKNANSRFILRVNITLSEINSGFPVLHIRKIPKIKYTIDELISLGVMDPAVANYLIWAAREAKGIVITGKGSAGKSTLMNTLLEYTPCNASGIVIQESEELFSGKPEMTFEHITEEYDLKELAKNGLLTDVDYFIIGEVKGEEAMYFINACDTGNKAWCSVHSPSSEEAINKLADYVMYASKYSRNEALYMLKELQVVVFMKNFKVAEISEVIGWDYEKKDLKYRTVFRREELINQRREPA